MNKMVVKSVAIGLVVGLLFLSGLAYPKVVAHDLQHAHHQASTHSTILCFWMCAAGQALDGIQFVLHIRFDPVIEDDSLSVQLPRSRPADIPASRGPPPLSS